MQGQTATHFGAQLLWHPWTINVSGYFARKHSAMDAFTSSQDIHGGSRPSLKYKKLIHLLKGEWHTSLRHTKNVCQLLLQPPEPDPQTGHHEQLVFKGHHCQPISTSHVLPASFLVRSTHLAEDFLLQLNTQRFPESFPGTGRQTELTLSQPGGGGTLCPPPPPPRYTSSNISGTPWATDLKLSDNLNDLNWKIKKIIFQPPPPTLGYHSNVQSWRMFLKSAFRQFLMPKLTRTRCFLLLPWRMAEL